MIPAQIPNGRARSGFLNLAVKHPRMAVTMEKIPPTRVR